MTLKDKWIDCKRKERKESGVDGESLKFNWMKLIRKKRSIGARNQW